MSQDIFDGVDNPFGIKPMVAIVASFIAIIIILLVDVLTPLEYRLVSLYLFPTAIIALNAKSMKVVFAALVLLIACENYLIIREHDFVWTYTEADVFNFLIRLLSTLLIIWLSRALRRSQLRVNLMANTDSLTGLWNRRFARISLEQAIAQVAQNGTVFSVGLIDVNHFKKINDVLGHLVGDQVLTHIARSLLKFSPQGLTFFRLGGDEFLILALEKNEAQMQAVCDEIVSLVDQEMLDLNYPVSLSIGAVTFHQPPLSVSDVLHQADVAMYQRKTEIKSRSNPTQA